MIKVNHELLNRSISFSTDFYKNALRQYKEGYVGDIIALMEQAELDSHTAGCLMGRKAGFNGNWKVTSAGESSEDKSIAEFVEGVFRSLNMRELFEDIFDARMKKFSVIELQWEVKEGKMVIASTQKLNQKYFRYNHKTNSVNIERGNTVVEIPHDAALVSVSNRTPVLLSVLRDYILKEFGLQSWLSFLETFGEAFIIGKYPPGADNDFKTEMESGILNLGASSRGVFPQGSDIEIIESKRGTGDHESFIAYCDKGISISLLGHANAVEGNRGLQIGNDNNAYQVKREIAVSDINFIEEYISKIIALLVTKNFGSCKLPLFTIDKSKPINVEEQLALIAAAYNQGYKIHPDEYAKLGLYKYEDQEPLKLNKEG